MGGAGRWGGRADSDSLWQPTVRTPWTASGTASTTATCSSCRRRRCARRRPTFSSTRGGRPSRRGQPTAPWRVRPAASRADGGSSCTENISRRSHDADGSIGLILTFAFKLKTEIIVVKEMEVECSGGVGRAWLVPLAVRRCLWVDELSSSVVGHSRSGGDTAVQMEPALGLAARRLSYLGARPSKPCLCHL